MSNHYDVLIVGGGPGGYVAAIRAAQLGLKTALVEKQHLGGICLNWGCIPTKALLKGAEVAQTLAHADVFGFSVGDVDFDFPKLVKHSRSVANRLIQGVAYLMKKNGVTVIDGYARITGKGRLDVERDGNTEAYRADHIILATGARPRDLPGIVADGERVWNYFHAIAPKALPSSLLVIGSGAIGTEFASLYRDLGVEVTLIEVLDQLLPQEDADVAALAARKFSDHGIQLKVATRVTQLDVGDDAVVCTLEDKQGQQQQLQVERVILAAGIQANIEDIGLESVGVETERGFIRTDPWGRTNVVGIYAIGDVAGPPCLAHKASHEGVVCIEKLAGVAGVHPVDRSQIPACTFCRPQIASQGMTEAVARQSGREIRVGRFDFQANGKAQAIGEAEGFIKTIFDARSGELLGAHMIGPEVTEQIQGFSIARSLEATEEDLAHAVFPHPTLSEAMHEAVLSALGREIHQ